MSNKENDLYFEQQREREEENNIIYQVCIIDEDGERFEQGLFKEKHTAIELRNKLIKDGFDYVAIFQKKDK